MRRLWTLYKGGKPYEVTHPAVATFPITDDQSDKSELSSVTILNPRSHDAGTGSWKGHQLALDAAGRRVEAAAAKVHVLGVAQRADLATGVVHATGAVHAIGVAQVRPR